MEITEKTEDCFRHVFLETPVDRYKKHKFSLRKNAHALETRHGKKKIPPALDSNNIKHYMVFLEEMPRLRNGFMV